GRSNHCAESGDTITVKMIAAVKIFISTLFHQFDVTDPARGIPGPPDSIRVARIDLDPAMIFFRVSESELCKRFRCRIETRDQIRMLLAEPNQFAFWIALDGIRAGVLSWRIEQRHLRC